MRAHKAARVWAALCAMALALVLAAAPVFAVQPDEMLADPVLEARARQLDHELRCVKCRSEAIASSNADWAADARRIVRELIAGGASDAEVKAYFVDRYGEYVLMEPNARGANWLLWAAGPLMLLIAGGAGVVYLRRRAQGSPAQEAALSAQEQDRLRQILDE
ncbi:MAG: cytochrome c-type biogenesis protein CcmH [Jhaorihella sp.]